jgi:2-amino-4-hydroxy-6-hydroxymethyldihydropteridine diphosphokinase
MQELQWSQFYHTPPLEIIDQPEFINAAACGLTDLDPAELLKRLLSIETDLGRQRETVPPRGPRMIDLDLILYGNLQWQKDDLELPHPRFRERRFVLVPARDIAADMRDPVTGLSIAELLAECPDDSEIRPVEFLEVMP